MLSFIYIMIDVKNSIPNIFIANLLCMRSLVNVPQPSEVQNYLDREKGSYFKMSLSQNLYGFFLLAMFSLISFWGVLQKFLSFLND